ncbi:MAG: GntR family transcriptional regulator [Cytophagales bacterium]|nr:GntR family transcriptional regulator [Armatimonadota bacterium]
MARDTTTKHEQLTQALQEMVSSLRPGDRFPSHLDLMRRFGVSDRTALRSLDELRRRGVIVRKNGVGTFVAEPEESAPPRRETAATRTIAVLTLTTTPFFQNSVRLLTDACEAQGLSVVCHYGATDDSFGRSAEQGVRLLLPIRPLGFLLFNYQLLPLAQELRRAGQRAVIIGEPPADVAPVVPCVYGDQEWGAYLAARHLLDLGHRRIGFIRSHSHGVPDNHPEHPFFQSRRWRGHLRALGEAGLLPSGTSPLVLTPSELAQWRERPEKAVAFFARPDAPTGLVAWNDLGADELLRTLARAGVRVPGQVSVIGYDALPLGATTDPPLDTIDQQMEAQVHRALDLLTYALPDDGSALPSFVTVPTLINRQSSAAPLSGRP